jgi:hypothetical protein
LVAANSLLKVRRIPLDPSENSGWIDLDTTLLHHVSQITIADAVLAVPPNTQQDDLGWKATALEQRQQSGSSDGRYPMYCQG